jgi:hypothetical protein
MDYSQNRKEFIEKFRQSNNNTINDSRMTNHQNETRFEGRWDYLHHLSKAKKTKFDQLREVKERSDYHKDMEECTFSPKVSKSKYVSNITHGNRSINQLENNQSLLDRQANWNAKKSNKLETIKNERVIKEYGQCYFSPKIVRYYLI